MRSFLFFLFSSFILPYPIVKAQLGAEEIQNLFLQNSNLENGFDINDLEVRLKELQVTAQFNEKIVEKVTYLFRTKAISTQKFEDFLRQQELTLQQQITVDWQIQKLKAEQVLFKKILTGELNQVAIEEIFADLERLRCETTASKLAEAEIHLTYDHKRRERLKNLLDQLGVSELDSIEAERRVVATEAQITAYQEQLKSCDS